MSDNKVHLSLKIRDLQIEFEGTENFMKNDLSNTMDNLLKFVENTQEHNRFSSERGC